MVELAKIRFEANFELETTELGKLKISHFKPGNIRNLQLWVAHLKNISPVDIVRHIVSLVAYIVNGKDDIAFDDQKVTIEEANRLSIVELNHFADQFVQYNDDILFKELKSNGKYERFATEKYEGESAVDYLARIIKSKFERDAKREKEFLKKIGYFDYSKIFPKDISDGFLKTIDSSRKLAEAMLPFKEQVESLQHYIADTRLNEIKPLTSPVVSANIPIIRNPIDATNNRLDKLLDYQADLGSIVEASAQLLKDMHSLGLKIDLENRKEAKKNYFISIIIILISSATLISTLIFSYMTYKTTVESSKSSDKNISILIDEMTKINQNIQSYQTEIKNGVKDISDGIKIKNN